METTHTPGTSTFPAKPDPTDPRTPAIMAWSTIKDGQQLFHNGPMLIYRKRTDEFLYARSAFADLEGMFEPLDSPAVDRHALLTREWRPMKYRQLYERVRQAFVYRDVDQPSPSSGLAFRLARCAQGRMVPVADPYDREVFTYRGRRLLYRMTFTRTKDMYKSWAEHIKNALDGYADLSWREKSHAKAELATFANDIDSSSARGWFVGAAREAFDDAHSEYPLTMANCGHAEDPDETQTDHSGIDYCATCAEDLREIDGEYYPVDECYYWESDGEYHTEQEPEEDEDEDEDEDADADADDSSDTYSTLIRSWGTPANSNRLDHYKPALTSPHTDFTMGVELEAECEDGRDFSDAVAECNDHFNADYRYAMFKRDGSLSDKGFEIVTAARLLPDHLKMFGSWTPHETMRSWKPGNCGTHVHIDSRAFSALTLGKFLMFINADHNVPLIKAIAGRHPRDDAKAQSYCAQLDQVVLGDPSKALKSNNNSRYRMVNLTNLSYDEQQRLKVENTSRDCKGDYSTVELRIFRASLKKERHLAQIEFTHAAVVFCRSASWHNLSGDHFKAWLGENADQYKNLARWFGLRVATVDKRKAKPVAVPEMEAECA